MSVSLLGDDGRGYELARRLEGCGAWRTWLGDSAYSSFVPSLSSPSAWDSFMSPPPINSNNQDQIHLQLRARALLFDKASISLFLNPSSSSSSISHLNPQYFQLHGDDIFFSLEPQREEDELHKQAQSRPAGKASGHGYGQASGVGSRYNNPENVNLSQRHRQEELPETWYSQYSEKFKARYHMLPHGDKESLKRTSEGMSAYLQLREVHKRKRLAFKDSTLENGSYMPPKIILDANGSTQEEISFFPEIMFPSNCVPDSPVPVRNEMEKNQKTDVYEILDNLPTVTSRSTAMMERFGIRPDYIKVGSKYRGIDGSGCEKKPLCEEQASAMNHKIVARLLVNAGFEGGTGSSIEVFSEFFSSHICRLGRMLKLITDSYRKQFSSIKLLQMFLQTAGYNNLGGLIESTKDGNKGIITQTPQQIRAVQSQHQNALLQAQAAQHLQRQMQPQPQMNMMHSQTLSFQQQQQQLEKLRRRQATTPRSSVMMMDKNQQPMVDVKIENSMESSPIDAATFNALNKQHPVQLRQQQLQQQQFQQQQMAMANHNAAHSGQQQFRQLQSAQISQLQMQNAYGMRNSPVKVEAFHELMGGDSTLNHEPEHNKLTSPSK